MSVKVRVMQEPALVSCVLFFFFQAEDGIRDLTVTGVQTCALPISIHANFTRQVPRLLARLAWIGARRRHRGSELARFGASQTSLDFRAADATPGRGDCWILKIAHGPSPKNLSKNGLPQKAVSLSV